jgi:hypothetical protein
MAEYFSSILEAAPWAPWAAGFFLVGLGFGWLLGGLTIEDDDPLKNRVAVVMSPGDADDRKEVVVLHAELEAARALLVEDDEAGQSVLKEIAELEETVKRANGRLKALMSAVRKTPGSNGH